MVLDKALYKFKQITIYCLSWDKTTVYNSGELTVFYKASNFLQKANLKNIISSVLGQHTSLNTPKNCFT